MKSKNVTNFGPSLILFTTIIIVWELSVHLVHINSQILPAPSVIASALFFNWNIIFPHIQQTLLETIIGIFIAIVLGAATAILLDTSSWVRRAVYPLLITSQTIPMIALAPLLLLWLGFDLLPKVIIVTLYCFFPIAIAMADGFAGIDPELVHVFKSMHASSWQTLRLLKIPSAMPSFFSGLKIAVTYSMTGAIVGEYIGAFQGLGIFIQMSANSHATALVFAAILITAISSLLLFGIVEIIERISLPWYFKNK